MNKNLLLAVALLLSMFTQAQTIVNITSDITSDQNWTNNNIYVLNDRIYVTNNATVTIQPGTIIKGAISPQGALIFTRGSKIIADGTAEQPIVFTSAQPAGSRAKGDWAGLWISGNAPTNLGTGVKPEGGLDSVKANYGGPDVSDSSGVLRYVRSEFGGYAYQPNSEVNGLTFAGVGSRTVVDHVMVSYAGDDATEWFGGSVNCKYMIMNKTLDDMFDTDFGWSGTLQFGLGVSDSATADISGSNGFESDNNNVSAANYAGTPQTKGIFTNVTVIGPKVDGSTSINPNFKRALHLRRNTGISVYNCVFTGFPTGLKIENQQTADNVTGNVLQFKNNIIAGCTTPLDSSTLTFGMEGWFNSNNNTVLANSSDINLANAYSYTSPSFLPNVSSPLLSGADFTSTNLSGNSSITPVTYRGAFNDVDWTKCWGEWNPQDADYSSNLNYGFTLNITQSGSLPSITLTADNVAGATYAWSDGGTSAATTATTAGTYTVTVTSSRGCVKTQSSTVISTGINEVSNINSVHLFPNPNNGFATLEITANNSSEVNVQVTDITGRTVTMFNKELSSGKNSIALNTADYAGGIYFVTVKTSTENKVVRMVVNK